MAIKSGKMRKFIQKLRVSEDTKKLVAFGMWPTLAVLLVHYVSVWWFGEVLGFWGFVLQFVVAFIQFVFVVGISTKILYE